MATQTWLNALIAQPRYAHSRMLLSANNQFESSTGTMSIMSYQPVIVFMHNDYIGVDRRFFVSIGDLVNGTLMHHSFAQMLSAELIERLRVHGRCSACNGPVDAALRACPCSHIPRHGGLLEVTILDRAAQPTFDSLVAKLQRRVKSATRRTRMAAVSATLTEAEVSMLLKWQCGLCFYCGQHFPLNGGQPIYRRDHVRALLHGGPTTIENTVLACVSCNARKGTRDATLFAREVARSRAPETKRDYTAMRRNFRRRLTAYLAARDASVT